ncbi:hypothetical protein B9Z55_022975 [Caenorhabditis nigoni]|uniref:Uncharacterized protein n=1 Tax=Caenorhabditis nigoni TaxID=1611254 RepID=A0A2G5SMK0_9PELO|nr:hypothetical protein B9Z55_022975 [Caenorhabditis nigoni]
MNDSDTYLLSVFFLLVVFRFLITNQIKSLHIQKMEKEKKKVWLKSNRYLERNLQPEKKDPIFHSAVQIFISSCSKKDGVKKYNTPKW